MVVVIADSVTELKNEVSVLSASGTSNSNQAARGWLDSRVVTASCICIWESYKYKIINKTTNIN